MLERYKDWVRRNAGLLSLFETGEVARPALACLISGLATRPLVEAAVAGPAAAQRSFAATARPSQACPASPGCCPSGLRRGS